MLVTLWWGLFWVKGNKPFVIYYAGKLLDDAQINYTTIEKEFLAIFYAFDKFRVYLMGHNVIVYSDHDAFKYLLSKKMQNLGS